ncbi:MAG: hypothetical protein K9N62_00105 [Verrucomicrobia bacterium]|nr:hypothetical protein [Verrucomicrobiota bacterium]
MRQFRGFLLVGSLCLFAATGVAQESGQVKELKLQLERMRAAFEKTQEQQRLQIEALSRQIEELQPKAVPDPAREALERELAEELAVQPGVAAPGPTPLASGPSTGRPLVSAGSAYLNVGFDLITIAGWSTDSDVSGGLNLGDHEDVSFIQCDRGCSLRLPQAVSDDFI